MCHHSGDDYRTKGVEIHENIKPIAGEKVFRKYCPNSFRKTGLLDYLKENNVAGLTPYMAVVCLCIPFGSFNYSLGK